MYFVSHKVLFNRYELGVCFIMQFVIEPNDARGAGDGRASKGDGREQAPVGLGQATYY